jgi:hypothetical protein
MGGGCLSAVPACMCLAIIIIIIITACALQYRYFDYTSVTALLADLALFYEL